MPLSNTIDPQLIKYIQADYARNSINANMIASENYPSMGVMMANGTHLLYKNATGNPDARYYNGCKEVDQIEMLAIDRIKKLLGVKNANVQPYSISQSSRAVKYSLLNGGDAILSLSHNNLSIPQVESYNQSSHIEDSWFREYQYGINGSTGIIDLTHLEDLTKKHKPKVISICANSYSRGVDYRAFREIANKFGALLWADISHIAGLVACNAHMSPVNYCDIITFNTHHTLRGPKGSTIVSNNTEIFNKVVRELSNTQDLPYINNIAAKAAAFYEASQPEFNAYIKQVLSNSLFLASLIMKNGIPILSGGTDNHMFTVNLMEERFSGTAFANALEACSIVTNTVPVPDDFRVMPHASGVTLGTAACTTRGLKNSEMTTLCAVITEVFYTLHDNEYTDFSSSAFDHLRNSISALMGQYKINWDFGFDT